MVYWICWLRGHKWGGWYQCLRPGLWRRNCVRKCDQRELFDEYQDHFS